MKLHPTMRMLRSQSHRQNVPASLRKCHPNTGMYVLRNPFSMVTRSLKTVRPRLDRTDPELSRLPDRIEELETVIRACLEGSIAAIDKSNIIHSHFLDDLSRNKLGRIDDTFMNAQSHTQEIVKLLGPLCEMAKVAKSLEEQIPALRKKWLMGST
jgi:hypothetical protein